MKAIAFILTLLVLVLNSTPCCFLEPCEDEVSVEQSGHEEEPCSNCSPFLSCGTCTGFVVQIDLPEVSSQSAEYKTDIFDEQEFHYSEFISRIWQPPQYI